MTKSSEKETHLIMPRQDVQDKIQKQIDEGEGFIKMSIPDEQTLKLADEAMASWYDYTRDLLLKLFNTDRIQREFVHSVTSWKMMPTFKERVLEFFQHADSRLNTLRSISRRLELFEEDTQTGPSSQVQENKGKISPVSESKLNWEAIEKEFGISKNAFGKKINFVKGDFKRSIIFRDVEHAFVLASSGFSKPAVILAGSVIEELLRLYLEYKDIKPKSDNFDDYIEACKEPRLLKSGVVRLSDSVRHFRNLVHLSREKTKTHTISKATAKGAVSSIFTISNDF